MPWILIHIFGTSGDGRDLTVYLQTESDGLVSFTVASAFLNAGGNWLNLTLPAAGRSLLDNLATGDRFIFALARPAAVTIDHTVDAGDVSWAFAVAEPTVTRVHIHTVDAGDAAFSFALPEPTIQRGRTRNAGDVSWSFALPQPSIFAAGSHFIDAGDAAFAFIIPQPSVTVGHAVNAGDVSWEFALPHPTVFTTGSHFVGAGDVAWAFDLPEPAITHTLRVPDAHTVDAGDIAWTFAAPQLSVTLTPRVTDTYTVNAGDTSFAFAIPQPSVVVAHTVNAGDVAWAFALTQPMITYTARITDTHAVNPGDVAWAFDIPRPMVTYIRGQRDYAIDTGDVAWAFAVTEPTVTYRGVLPGLPPLPAPIPVTDRIIALDDLLDLLISQYTGNAPINALLRGMYELIDTEFVQALRDLERMRNWDTAEGVWLNYIGRRLGMERPSIDTVVTRLGFDGGDGVGFNQAPFATATGFVPQVAVSDAVYLLCLKVWAGTILTSGTIPDMNAAVQRSFPNAYYTDGADSTIALATGASGAQQTTARNILTAADAWPRPAGVGLTVT